MAWNAGFSHEWQNKLNVSLAMILGSSFEVFRYGGQNHLLQRSHSMIWSLLFLQTGTSFGMSEKPVH